MKMRYSFLKVSLGIQFLALCCSLQAEPQWDDSLLQFLVQKGGAYHTSTQIVTDKDAGKTETHSTVEGTVITFLIGTLVYKIMSPLIDQALPMIVNSLPAVGPIAELQKQYALKTEDAQLNKIIDQSEIEKKRLLVKKILENKAL